MASIVSFDPSGVAAKALFNFDQIDQTPNFKLSGVINVSVSDAFTKANYTQSILPSEIYTSLASGSVNWTATQLTNIQAITDIYSQFVNVYFSKVANDSGSTPAQVVGDSDINISLIYRPSLSFSGITGVPPYNFGYSGGELDIFLNTAGFGGGDTSLVTTTWGGHALMHEIGHALGLSHPHSSYVNGAAVLTANFASTVNLGFSKLGFVTNTAAEINKEYFTIMSYDDQVPKSGVNTYAQTPMILDVLALQEAYGAGLGSSGTGNDVIAVGSASGVDSYRTYFDTGGLDTINLANYTSGAYLHLGTTIAGAQHLVGVSMSLADRALMLAGNSPQSLRWFYGEFENVTGGAGNDVIVGNALNNVINGAGGGDTIDGGGGFDTLIYSGTSASHLINVSSSGKASIQDTIAARDGTDSVTNISRLQFATTDALTGVNRVALDIGPTEHAGSVYMLYQAAFNRTPDPSGLGYWIAKIDSGVDVVQDIASFFVISPEFVAKYGANPSNASYVDNLYQNVLHRTGEAGGVKYWNEQLNANAVSRAYVLEQFATLPEGAALVASALTHGIAYVQWTA